MAKDSDTHEAMRKASVEKSQNETEQRADARAINDRIVELRRVPANQIKPHPENWREHPREQQTALEGLIAEVGIADAVLAYEPTPGELVLIDGHLRRDTLEDTVVPVLVTDLTEDEARLMLATHDPLTEMARQNDELMRDLLEQISAEDASVQKLLEELSSQAQEWSPELLEAEPPEPENSALKGKIVVQCLQADAQAIADRISEVIADYDNASIT